MVNSVMIFIVQSSILAGGLAAFWPSLVICPTELVKCRLQAAREAAMMEGRPQPKLGPLGLTRQVLNTEGVPGLYRGLTATFVREIPGYFFFFLAYEGVRELLKPEGGSRADVGALGTVGAGAVAGVVSLQLVDADDNDNDDNDDYNDDDDDENDDGH